MTKFQVLVVDDEPLAREVAVSLVRRDSEVAAVAECGDGLRARQVIEETRPDIVFLDVEMPGLDGVQLAEHLPGRRAGRRVHHGVQPVRRRGIRACGDRLRAETVLGRAVSRGARTSEAARARASSRRAGPPDGRCGRRAPTRRAGESTAGSPRHLQRLSIKQGDRTVVLRAEEIVWIEAQDYCVTVHSTRGNHLVRASLTSLEGRLAPDISSARIAWRSSTCSTCAKLTIATDFTWCCRRVRTSVSAARAESHIESLLSPRLR